MSETPRTDKTRHFQASEHGIDYVHASFSKDLERELAAANQRVANVTALCNTATNSNASLKAEVERLREALGEAAGAYEVSGHFTYSPRLSIWKQLASGKGAQ